MVSAVAFVLLANPGPQPAITSDTTGLQITKIISQHKELLRILKEYLNTDKALRQQLLATFDKM